MEGFLRRLLRRAPAVDHVVRRELLVQSAEASTFSNLTGLLMLGLIVVILRHAEIGPGLWIWAGLQLVQSVVFHVGLRRQLQREATSAADVQRQTRILTVLYLFGGFFWGLLTVLVLPGGVYAEYRAVPCIVVIVALAANIAFSSATPMPFLAFHLALSGTATVGLLRADAYALVVMMLFCLGAALPLQRDLYLQISGAKLLARRNLLLAHELRGERAAVEQTNLRLVEANVELSHRATRDPLTGLANRALFSEHLSSTLARSRQVGRSISVIYVDLDRFKLINDTLGHAAGDELLRQVGARIVGVLREADVLARLGGDEFVVLTLSGEDVGAAEAVAYRIRSAFQTEFQVQEHQLRVTPSLGVAHDDGHSSGDQLVANADAALYRAKELGRNRVAVFDDSLRSTIRERAQEGDLLRRLSGDPEDVDPQFRPVLDLRSGVVVAAEAAIRLRARPDAPCLDVDKVRTLAARTGLHALLDEELLRQSARFQAGPGQLMTPGFRVLTRLGRTDVGFDDLIRFLGNGFREAGLGDGAGLAIAVSEEQIVSDRMAVGERIQAVRRLGVRVVLDDFGRGVSSLSLLSDLPWDGLRLHADLSRPDGSGSGLLAGIVQLARPMGLPVTATAVPDRDQLDRLQRLGVDQAQGDAVAVPESWAGFAEVPLPS